MARKIQDNNGRYRSKTIAFRVSPEENTLLNKQVRLSGLTKQEYLTNNMLKRDIVVMPNPRVHKALKETMIFLCEAIMKLESVDEVTGDMASIISMTEEIYNGLTEGR